jgi:predicted AlkP superfamily phosphohydrolase/phosphomutase
MKPKVIVIGLDAATMSLVRPWSEAGHLPVLEAVMREGAHGELISTPNMHSASAWTSILSGLNPGRHGLFVFSDRDFFSGKQLFFKGGDRDCEIISSHLSRHGLKSGLLNVPMTFPAECTPGGFAISGLDAPALEPRAFCPAGLHDEVLREFPDYNFSPPGLGDLMRAGRLDEAVGAWMRLIETQTSVAEYLMNSRPVDFFMTVYTASDWGGHNLWKQQTGEDTPLLSIYRALDSAVGRLLDRAGSSTQVYVISDHGMGLHTGASYHLAGWLEDRGYMARRRGKNSKAALIDSSRRAARRILPLAIREKVKSSIGPERVKRIQASEKDSFYSTIDWQRTTAYTEPGRHVINVNLAGRNQFGTVAESDYDRFCLDLIDDLMKWKDRRGVPFVERTARRDEVYSGPHAGRASDLYVYWNPEADAGEPPEEVRARGFWWSGDHRPEGMLICRGPGIRSGYELNRPSVYDLLPTIMYLAGLPVPSGLDGRVIRDAVAQEYLAENPVRDEPAGAATRTDSISLSESEEGLIEEKLRSLGYM